MTASNQEGTEVSVLRTPGGGHLEAVVATALDALQPVSPDLPTVLLRDTLRLWGEFFSDGSLYTMPKNADHSVVPADLDNLLGRAGTLARQAESLIQSVISVDVHKDDAIASLAGQLLTLFESALQEAFGRSHARDAQIVDAKSGQWVDASVWRHGWERRRHMLQETAECLPYLDEVRAAAVASVQQTDVARSEMQSAIADLELIEAHLKEARAERAQNELTTHFSTLAGAELVASNVFRAVTGVLLIAAIVVGWRLSGVGDWDGALAHVLVVAAIGGAAAYSARLGSTHRATANWAKSIHVQLDTFKDFLAEVTDEDVKNRVYEEFGRRVLGAPPAANGEEAAPLPTAQVIELASIIANAQRK